MSEITREDVGVHGDLSSSLKIYFNTPTLFHGPFIDHPCGYNVLKGEPG